VSKIEKLLYKIDKILAKYPNSKIWLFLFLSVVFVVFGAILLSFKEDFFRALWDSWTYFADPGTHVAVEGGYLRFISVFITILGLLFFAVLIGLVSEVIEEKIDSLKLGKSKVFEENHIVILGFSSQIIPIIKQLQLANSNNIVILSQLPKLEMEEFLSSNDIDNVICRNGDIDNIYYLNKINIQKSKSIIIVSNNDELNLKLILLLTKKLKLNIPINIEIKDEEFKESLNFLEKEYPNLNFIYTKQSLARLLALSAIYIGIGQTYDKLFDYKGDSFYLIENISFLDKSLFEIATMIDERVCGIYSNQENFLKIDKNYKYQKDDKLLIISNNSDYNLTTQTYNLQDINFQEIKNNNVNIIGDNEKKEFILDELNIRKIKITPRSKNLILIGKNDNEVISNLLLLRKKYTNILTEVYTDDLVKVLSKEDINDYIISHQLVAKLLVSVSFSNELNLIINDLLDKGGNIMYIIKVDNSISYSDLYFSLLNQNIIPIGVIDNEIILNPKADYSIKNQEILVISNKG